MNGITIFNLVSMLRQNGKMRQWHFTACKDLRRYFLTTAKALE
jgi:hypothetical protein